MTMAKTTTTTTTTMMMMMMMMMIMMMMDINSRKLLKNFDVDGEPSKRFTKAEVFVFSLF